MFRVPLILQVLATYFCFVNGETECRTAEGQLGTCVSIYSCPHILKLLQPPPPVTKDIVEYVKKSRCTSPHLYSVCCRTSQHQSVAVSEFKDDNRIDTVPAFPPDPKPESCGKPVSLRTAGRLPTLIDEFPWLAIIEYTQQDKIKLLCGGALISGRYVLTAAHCVVGDILQSGTPENVRLGEYDISNEGKDCVDVEFSESPQDCTDAITVIPIERTIPHPDYSTSKRPSPNDIALIRLKQNAPFSDFIRPICLPTAKIVVNPYYNRHTVAGWGAMPTTAPSSNVQLNTELEHLDKHICARPFELGGRNLTLTDGQLSSDGDKSRHSCIGDSGGPLMFEETGQYVVIGVASFGFTPCRLSNVTALYTDVCEYIDWIRNTMAS